MIVVVVVVVGDEVEENPIAKEGYCNTSRLPCCFTVRECEPYIYYDERLSYLNLESLSVHLDITCLKYVSKVSSNTDHPLARYQPQLRTTVKTHRKGLARPTSRTALCGRSLFHKYF